MELNFACVKQEAPYSDIMFLYEKACPVREHQPTSDQMYIREELHTLVSLQKDNMNFQQTTNQQILEISQQQLKHEHRHQEFMVGMKEYVDEKDRLVHQHMERLHQEYRQELDQLGNRILQLEAKSLEIQRYNNPMRASQIVNSSGSRSLPTPQRTDANAIGRAVTRRRILHDGTKTQRIQCGHCGSVLAQSYIERHQKQYCPFLRTLRQQN